MVAQLSFGQTKRGRRHKQTSDKSTASYSLTIAAVTLKGHDGLSRAFVTNRTAYTAASKRKFHNSSFYTFLCRVGCNGPRSFVRRIYQRMTSPDRRSLFSCTT